MKKINIFRMGVVAMLAIASCSTEKLNGPDSGKNVKGVHMSLTAYEENSAPEGKTVLGKIKDGKAEVWFTSSDKLLVYGTNGEDIQGAQFDPEDTGRKTDYNFSTDNWPEGYTPIYAVATTSTTSKNVCTAEGEITMLVNNQTQSFKWSDSYAVNTVGHVGKVEDGATVLKNVCGLIQFSVTNDEIVKIVVTANGGEPLGGWITVDYSKLESTDSIGFYTPGADADQYKVLTLTVQDPMDNGATATGGKFPVKNKYFISLLPGVYSKGITITMFNDEGKVMTREINSPLTIKRGQIRKISKAIDDGFVFKDPEMPDELTFVLVDAGVPWPFKGKITTATAQKVSGETYTYPYTDPASGYSEEFSFMLCNAKGESGNAYAYSSGALTMKSPGDWIKLPAVEGRVLVSLVISHSNTNTSRKFSVGSDVGNDDYLSDVTIVSGDTAYVAWNANAPKKPEIGKAAYINCKSNSFKMSKVVAVYAKAFPKSETIVLDCTDAANFRYLKDGVPSSLSNATHATAFTECDFWLDGKEEYVFHGSVQRWGSENLNADKNSPVKLPTIEGYKLSNVNIASYSQSAKTIRLTDGTKDLASITLLRADGYNDMVIDDTQAEGNDRYIVSASELGVKFTLTYKLIK